MMKAPLACKMPERDISSLRCYLNWLSLSGLREPEQGWLNSIREAGYDGVQFIQPLQHELVIAARGFGLGVCGSGRVDHPEDAGPLAMEGCRAGLECLTLHIGWGHEGDEEAWRLIDAVLNASSKYGLPLYVETHRATIFQDMWRSVQFTRRFPELRFNGDFSHWYTGSEMVYGDFRRKLDFIQPVIERVRFLHGRIGSPGCIQVDIGNGDRADMPFVEHFREMWRRVFRAFLRNRCTGEAICFTAELLAPDIYYARTFQGQEESDRWQQSLRLVEIAKECFREVQQS